MRRAVLTLGSTAAGLAALLTFKTHSAATETSPPAAAAPPAASSAGTSSAARTSPSVMAGSQTHAASAQPSAPQTSAPAVETRTVTGTVANTQYGPMQVQLTLTGTKITKATVLQRTDDGSESDQIDSSAIPRLESETLAAQSASIDAVSGASYTSSGYIQSLQSAVDQAKA